ncbi:MAG: nucleotide sugar dehydrogenase [Bacteroidales bacterium]|nr:nucleotide sugar dehydrogenase [Bacteroidales bacterium]MDT8430666.1 nucleotide sugar dehydrogenase [Bacteroidales bacterium]
MYKELVDKKKTMAVIGLGYVGLPIALEFAKKIKVIGFDIREDRIEQMKRRIDPSNELEAEDFDNTDITFTANIDDLKTADFYIVAVPTPIDEHKKPDLNPLLSATRTVGKVLSKGNYVVYESTVYPGCTEEDCIPLLSEISGLEYITDYKVGFSPERINPGDKKHTLTSITKVTSGCDAESAEEIAKTYEIVIAAGVHRASSIKVAEAAKIIENTQRDINIAFMNELSMIFNKMNINTFEVLEAAGTKWNFLPFFPGLVGGHCIGVDPYYLTHKSAMYGHHAQIINAGRGINDGMAAWVAKQVTIRLSHQFTNLKDCRVLVMGTTFKENVSDIRNSKVADVVYELKEFGMGVEVIDPYADPEEVQEEYGYSLIEQPSGKYHAVIVAVSHAEYAEMDEAALNGLLVQEGLLVDLKGLFRNRINNLNYWSL